MINDSKLRHDVEAELDWDPRFDARQVGVAVKNGAVALTGHVASFAERCAAEEAAKSVAGVRALANDIVVELPFDAKRSDAEIAEAALFALNSNASVPPGKVTVIVRDGWITLEGHVAMWFERNAAHAAVANLRGIKGVFNKIAIKTEVSAADVRSRIEEAFRRRAQINGGKIRVAAQDGTVTLEGEVQSWDERNQAELAAWQARGVSTVIDKLSVHPL
jgi:osmotically-inducible protein OsmY